MPHFNHFNVKNKKEKKVLRKPRKPRHVWSKNQGAFYRWWRNIYKEDMDLLYLFSTPTATITQTDYIKWGKLYGYYFGLCDGRRRVNDGPW